MWAEPREMRPDELRDEVLLDLGAGTSDRAGPPVRFTEASKEARRRECRINSVHTEREEKEGED